jgi:hypothetical protein
MSVCTNIITPWFFRMSKFIYVNVNGKRQNVIIILHTSKLWYKYINKLQYKIDKNVLKFNVKIAVYIVIIIQVL